MESNQINMAINELFRVGTDKTEDIAKVIDSETAVINQKIGNMIDILDKEIGGFYGKGY